MKISQIGLDFIKKHEGLRLNAYLDQVGVPTIGYGNTQYENGKKVQMGDKITLQRANELFSYFVNQFAFKVNKLVRVPLTQNQFDALVSLSYNIGIGNFGKSTLLKKLNVNPANPSISAEFAKWKYGGGKVLPGLVKRRAQEYKLYNS